ESGQAIGAELAEMQRWTQRLLEKAGTDNPIDIQLGSIGYLQALEAIRAGEDPRVPAESARHYLATATDNPIDAREAHLLLAQLACAEHRWNLGQDRFDPQRAESDADTVLAAVRQYPDSAWLKAEAARLLS